MHNVHVHAPFRYVVSMDAWIMVICMHLNYKCIVMCLHQHGVQQ